MNSITAVNDNRLSIIVVTHNSASCLPLFLRSLTEVPDPTPTELVIIDNASTDGSPDLVRETFPNATLLVNKENRGFAAAVNQGTAWAQGEFLLLVNPDVRWSQAVIAPLVAFLQEHPKAAAVCPKLIFPDGRPQLSIRRFPTHANIWCSRGSPLRWLDPGRATPWGYTKKYPKSPSRVPAVAATFMLIRRAAFDAVGGFDAGYFLYVEDTDLCKRWRDKGWEVWVDALVTVTHDWQGGSKRDPRLARLHRASVRRYFHMHHRRKQIRNSILFSVLGLANVSDRVRGRSEH